MSQWVWIKALTPSEDTGYMIIVKPLAFNSAGAVGDLWMTFVLLQMPEHVLVKDNIMGLTFYGKPSDDQPDISSLSFPPLLLPVSVMAGLIYTVIKSSKKRK